jgi:hypothetical protein
VRKSVKKSTTKVFSAPLGTAQQFRENLDRIAEDLRSLSEFNDGVVREYIEGRAPFQNQAYDLRLGARSVLQWRYVG